MDNILGQVGFTSSEANHITNIIKELVKDIDSRSASMPLKTSTLKINGEDMALDDNKRIEDWVQLIQRKGELYSLSAWLKSGIKTKEGMLNALEYQSFTPTVELQPLEKMPKKPSTEFGDFLCTLTTKQRADYLSAEAMAAHIGKFIHNFDELRGQVDNFEKVTVKEYKDSVGIIKHTLLYSKEELLEGFFELQKQHRDAEKIVNSFKASAKTWEKNTLDEYAVEVARIAHKNTTTQNLNNLAVRDQESEHMLTIRNMKAELAASKILIPKDLQYIVDFVQEYSKK